MKMEKSRLSWKKKWLTKPLLIIGRQEAVKDKKCLMSWARTLLFCMKHRKVSKSRTALRSGITLMNR